MRRLILLVRISAVLLVGANPNPLLARVLQPGMDLGVACLLAEDLVWPLCERYEDPAEALFHPNEERDDNAALEAALERYQALLRLRSREDNPLEWAMAQINLGAVLLSLGQREEGTIHLEEAVQAYRAALEELSRARTALTNLP